MTTRYEITMSAGGRGSFKIAAGILLSLAVAWNVYFVHVRVDLNKYVDGANDIYGVISTADDGELVKLNENDDNGDGNSDGEGESGDVDVDKVVSNPFANGSRINASLTAEDYFHTEEYRVERVKRFHSWYKGNRTEFLLPDADKNGPILDFAVVGLPKCGTTTIEANLGKYAPMPIADVCTPSAQTVYYRYVQVILARLKIRFCGWYLKLLWFR